MSRKFSISILSQVLAFGFSFEMRSLGGRVSYKIRT
jgi:hypothetical protein